MKKIILLIHLLISLNAISQSLPTMKDWFLAIGDWDNAPQIYVREYGTGSQPVILLHGGWGADHEGMIEMVAALASDYKFIFYDQRGSLRSPFPDSLITFDQHIEDLERLRQEFDFNKVTIVGHSMGSVLAGAYASKYPDKIKKMVLLAPAFLKNPIPESDKELSNQQFQRFGEFMKREAVSDQLKAYGLAGDYTQISSREKTAIFRINFANRMLHDVSKWPQLSGGRALYKGHVFGLTEASYPENGWDYFKDFNKANYPVKVIVGDHDFLDFGNGLISKWIKDTPRAELTIIPKAGHLLWIDQPAYVSKALKEALMD